MNYDGFHLIGTLALITQHVTSFCSKFVPGTGGRSISVLQGHLQHIFMKAGHHRVLCSLPLRSFWFRHPTIVYILIQTGHVNFIFFFNLSFKMCHILYNTHILLLVFYITQKVVWVLCISYIFTSYWYNVDVFHVMTFNMMKFKCVWKAVKHK